MTTITEARLAEPYVYAVWNSKGGVGKSLLSMAFAAATAADSGTAYMVDIDNQATTAQMAKRADSIGNPWPFSFVADTDPANLVKLRKVRGVDSIFVDCPQVLLDAIVMDEVLPLTDFVIIPYVHDPVPCPRRPARRTRSAGPADTRRRSVWINRVDNRRGSSMLDDAIETLDKLQIPRFRSFVREYAAHSLAHTNGQMITQYRGRHASDARGGHPPRSWRAAAVSPQEDRCLVSQFPA